MTIIGIDPGITGAIAAIFDNGGYQVLDIPVMANGKGKSKVKNHVNAAGVLDILKSIGHATVYIERVSARPMRDKNNKPVQGSASTFSLGDTFGCLRGVCAAAGYPVEFITPQSWKRHFRLSSDKEQVRARAIELFPSAPLGRKRDHNRAEALLIAKYGLETA